MQSFGKEYLPLDLQRSGGRVYLHMLWRKVPKSEAEVAAAAAAPVTKFAIGVEGGFQTEESKWTVEKTHQIVTFPGEASYPYVFSFVSCCRTCVSPRGFLSPCSCHHPLLEPCGMMLRPAFRARTFRSR